MQLEMLGIGKNTEWKMKWINFLIVLLCTLSLQAQYDGQDSLIKSRYRPGFMWFYTGLRPADVEKPRKYDRLMVDVSYSMLLKDNKEIIETLPISSFGTGIHLMFDKPLTKRNGVALGFGLSYKIQRAGYKGSFSTMVSPVDVEYMEYGTAQNTTINKQSFVNQSFAIPLELRFRMRKWRQAKLHLGGFVGYRFLTYTKVHTNESKYVLKSRITNLNEPLDYGVHLRFGIRNWAIFGSYSLAKQFKEGQSTVINPVSFGLTISLF